jgi:hypothetical protein
MVEYYYQCNNKACISFVDGKSGKKVFQKLKVKILDSIILVTTNRYPEYKYLDKIKITGKLETPSVTDDFNYKNYLMKDGIYSVMGFPKIEIVCLGCFFIFTKLHINRCHYDCKSS